MPAEGEADRGVVGDNFFARCGQRDRDIGLRDKASLDLFWLKDESLDNLDDLPPPDVLQQEIIDHLEAALAAFRDVAAGLPQPIPSE